MEIRRAETDMTEAVRELCRETIEGVYPKYYPRGAVDFFLEHHNIQNIRADVEAGVVYLLYDGDPRELRGTVTVKGNDICRLFVPERFQHVGYGRSLLDMAEDMIARGHSRCIVHASFPAKHIYLKRGYRETEYHRLQTPGGDFLCWDIMAKELSGDLSDNENSPVK